MSTATPHGVFVGLATLDVISRVATPPGRNAKVTAQWQQLAAGGPAAGAAVVFAALGGEAQLLTRIGEGAAAQVVRADLDSLGVDVIDFAEAGDTASVSAVTVDASTGERQVVGRDAAHPAQPLTRIPLDARTAIATADVVLLDGHLPDLTRLAAAARAGERLILDAGRYKPVFADMLASCTDVIASSDFRIPGYDDPLEALSALGVPMAAVSAGAGALRWRHGSRSGELRPPVFEVVDTLGAGDTLHGAYAHAIAQGAAPEAALARAMEIASLSCTENGTRSWLRHLARSG